MDLFLHIGTEKTASSFLQTVAARNRDWLQNKGIFFPHAGKNEKMMQAGKISPGNGKDLYEALKREQYDEVFALLKCCRQAAENLRCGKVLISNENLLEPLANPEIAENFLTLLQRTGMTLAPFLLMLREPVDQALSLYKHRAKSGDLESLEKWLATGYHLPFYLQGFFEWVDQRGLGLYLAQYQNDSSWLVRGFFETWLGLSDLPAWEETSVNPSLTLSELFLIRGLRQTRPAWVSFLYDSLLDIPKVKKSDDLYLKAGCTDTIRAHLSQFQSVWKEVNRRLPAADQFSLPEIPGKDAGEKNDILSFTPEQMRVLTNFWLRTRTPAFLFHAFWRHQFRPFLAQVKWRIIKVIRKYKRVS